ncbi:MAG: AAA family ATPase [Spirochaetales bacterium]|nr:AAA family ATPase [Spirochaetales bacterium]
MLKAAWPAENKIVILDEIHKYSRWKSFIKGEYDVKKEYHNFLITGSARLDMYKKGGDSLFGRYHYYRLHPFSYAELNNLNNTIKPGKGLFFPRKFRLTMLMTGS